MTVGGNEPRSRFVMIKGESLYSSAPVPGKATEDSVPGIGGRFTSTKMSKKLCAGKSGLAGPLTVFSWTIHRLLGLTPAPVPAFTIGQESGTEGMRGSGGQCCPAESETLSRIKLRISVRTSSAGAGAPDHRAGMAA